MNMGRVFANTANREPQNIGLVDPETNVRYTYREWYERIISIADGLKSRGVGTQDKIGTVMRNRAELPTLYFATQMLGAVFVPLNFRNSTEELKYLINKTDLDSLVYSRDVADEVEGAARELDVPLFTIGGRQDGKTSYEELLNIGNPQSFTPNFIDPDETSIILHTAGTTGSPKAVPRTHRATHTSATAHALQNSWTRGESTLGIMSLSHTMGIHALASIVLLGGTWVVQSEFSPDKTFENIESESISSLYLVPTVYHDLIYSDKIGGADLSSVNNVAFAGASMRPSDLQTLYEIFTPDNFVNHYGSTEVYTHSFCPWVNEKPNSSGISGLNTRIRVVEADRDGTVEPTRTVKQGTLGEIIVDATSPEAFEGYLNRPEANENAFEGDWYFTGDIGYKDEDGELFVVGRVDDMIISGGENIYPIEVENVLLQHEKVGDVAVVGRPSERWNQAITAFVTPSGDPEEDDFDQVANALDDYCRRSDKLADFKRPRKYYFIDEFSKSHVGKIMRKELQRPDLNMRVYSEVNV